MLGKFIEKKEKFAITKIFTLTDLSIIKGIPIIPYTKAKWLGSTKGNILKG